MAARRLHGLIYITIALCCMSIVICSVALGTDQWFSAKVTDAELKLEVKYGLFKGQKTKGSGVSTDTNDLKLVCQGAKCMYSCGTTTENRKNDLKSIIDGTSQEGSDGVYCSKNNQVKSGRQSGSLKDPVFLNFGIYIITILFLGLAMIFSVLGGGLALYNTYRTPIQPVLSVFGLYIWNGISAACVVLGMIMWGVAFSTTLRKNAGVSDTLIGVYDSEGKGSMGISYWILPLAAIFSLVNIAILRYRSWKIVKMEEKNVKVMTEKLESGDILLF